MTWQATSLNGCRIGTTRITTKRRPSQTLKDLRAAQSRQCAAARGSSLRSVSARATATGVQWIVVPAEQAFAALETRFSLTDRYLSRKLSCTDFSNGLSRYSMTRRLPVLISTVTAIPGERGTCLPSTWIVARSILTRVG